MKKWWNESGYIGIILVGVLFLVLSIWGTETYSTVLTPYTIINPTENQVKEILRGDIANRVYLKDAHQVYQGSSIIIVSLGTRKYETGRAETFLQQLGVNYERQNR